MRDDNKEVWIFRTFFVHVLYYYNNNTCTVFDLFPAHTPISTQSSNSVVFRLQPVYFLPSSLCRHKLCVPI